MTRRKVQSVGKLAKNVHFMVGYSINPKNAFIRPLVQWYVHVTEKGNVS
jgi:hypothetical protein